MSRITSIVALGTVLAFAAHAAADRVFMPVDLETLGGEQSVALGLNDLGHVVGWSETAQPVLEVHAFLWADGEMEDLDTLGGAWSEGRAINDMGVVVGASDAPDGRQHGFVWYDGVMHNLTDLLHVPPPDFSAIGDPQPCYTQIERFVEANDINEHGWIAGCAYMEEDPNLHGIMVIPLFEGPPTGLVPEYFYVDLGRLALEDDCLALGLNDMPMVVGISGHEAFRWMDDVIMSVDRFAPASYANDVNEVGTVAGWIEESSVDVGRQATVWVDGYRRVLGGFGEATSEAIGINGEEIVVGYIDTAHCGSRIATLWEGCIPYDLNEITLVPMRAVDLPWDFLTEATDINDANQVVGFGTSIDGKKRAFLLFDPTDP